MDKIISNKLVELKAITNTAISHFEIDAATAEDMRMKAHILVSELISIGLDYEEIQEVVFN